MGEEGCNVVGCLDCNGAAAVKDAMEREVYYGLNLFIVLSEETSAEERATILAVMERAKAARKEKAMKLGI